MTNSQVNPAVRGGSLVLISNGYKPFELKFDKNTEFSITNPDGHKVSTSIKDGKAGVFSPGIQNLIAVESYTIINDLRRLDGDETDLSERDFTMANTDTFKRSHNIKQITINKQAQLYTITRADGSIIKIDYETEEEKNAILSRDRAREIQKRQEIVNRKLENTYNDGSYSAVVVEKNGKYFVYVTLKKDKSFDDILKDFKLTEKNFPNGHKANYRKNEVISIQYDIFQLKDNAGIIDQLIEGFMNLWN